MEKRYYSPNEMNRIYGIPITMLRKEIKQGRVPGFASGRWFHVDAPAYLELLSKRNDFPSATAE